MVPPSDYSKIIYRSEVNNWQGLYTNIGLHGFLFQHTFLNNFFCVLFLHTYIKFLYIKIFARNILTYLYCFFCIKIVHSLLIKSFYIILLSLELTNFVVIFWCRYILLQC